MKNAFCKMCVTICGRFRLNEGGVASYGNRMKAKYTVNWGVQVVGMVFQTRSKLTNPSHPILPICDFSRGVLNVRIKVLVSNTCFEATNREYGMVRILTLAR